MTIDGLGLVSAPLYLFPKFFEGKAIERLIGKGIQASHLNEHRLGRVLDKLYLVGTSQTFTTIALAASPKFEIKTETSHLDSSSFHLHGKYESELRAISFAEREIDSDRSDGFPTNPVSSPIPIKITYGYSQGPSPDLKQFILDFICSSDGDVPLFLRVGSGNESNCAVFASICQEFKKQLNLNSLMVADSALYTRVRASQSCLTKAFKNLHHIIIVHRSPFDFLSQTTLESCFLVDRIKDNPSYHSEVLRTV